MATKRTRVYFKAVVNVEGRHLDRAPALVRQLEKLECDEHTDLADVRLNVAEDGSVEWNLNAPCCATFRETATGIFEAHNKQART